MEHENEDFFSGVLKIALGIALGLGIAWAAKSAYDQYQLERLAKALHAEVVASQERARESQALREARERMAAIADSEQRAAAIRDAAAITETERLKQAAWQRFYQVDPKCQSPSSFDVSVECGNAHIRAKRHFEAKWAAGDI